ncbi:MAG: hypothetical protein EOO73_27470 [Myxococcales bacterium]|nr:MAG: hypothetical protein EOO73_27470 [Myxococcales bacterium]
MGSVLKPFGVASCGVVLALASCQTKSPPEGEGGAATNVSGAAGSEPSTAGEGAGFSAGNGGGCDPADGSTLVEPPPYLLYFSGFEDGRAVNSVAIGDRHVYWNLNGGRFMRAAKDGSDVTPELFLQCSTCDLMDFLVDAEAAYFLNGAELLRVDVDTKAQRAIALDFDHVGRGALMADDTYLYTAMPGCAAITRIHKQTFAKEVLPVVGVEYPGAGVTTLDKTGERIVCGSPTQLFVFDSWGTEPRVEHSGIDVLWGFAMAGEVGYWLEQPTSSPPPVQIGRLAVTGGQSGLLVQESQAGHTNRLVFASSIDKVLFGNIAGIRAFDARTEMLGKLVELGRPTDLAVDDEFVYASVLGRPRRSVGGEDVYNLAYWVARVPLSELE